MENSAWTLPKPTLKGDRAGEQTKQSGDERFIDAAGSGVATLRLQNSGFAANATCH